MNYQRLETRRIILENDTFFSPSRIKIENDSIFIRIQRRARSLNLFRLCV